jgi:sulfide:quinone oxidoreductase
MACSRRGRMRRKQIVVVGCGFAGRAAAIELERLLGAEHDVTVVSKSDELISFESLVQVASGLRGKRDLGREVRSQLVQCGIRFLLDHVTRFDLDQRAITTRSGRERYDYLLIATGAKPNDAAVPGLGPRGYAQSILSPLGAERARFAFERFAAEPGPVVLGGVQGASRAAARALMVGMARQIRSRGLADRAPITYLTAEPSLAHLDPSSWRTEVGEALAAELNIRTVTGAVVRQIEPGAIQLADGRTLPFAYAALIPPVLGVDAVRLCDRVTSAAGFVRVDEFGQIPAYPEVFAAGSAAVLDLLGPPTRDAELARWPGLTGSIESTEWTAERNGRIAARNIAAQLRGGEMFRYAVHVDRTMPP